MISLPSDLVVQAVVGQEVLVEEVAERAVAHVVQQGGQPHQRLDVAAAGHVGADLAQALVERGDGPAGQVHRPEHVLEPRVLGRGKDPPGGLQLVNLPQPLQPGMVDDLLLGHLARRQPRRRGERDVAVDRIVAQALALEVSHGSFTCWLTEPFSVVSNQLSANCLPPTAYPFPFVPASLAMHAAGGAVDAGPERMLAVAAGANVFQQRPQVGPDHLVGAVQPPAVDRDRRRAA